MTETDLVFKSNSDAQLNLEKNKRKSPWYTILIAVIFCIAAVILLCYSIFTLVFIRTKVIGPSMQPTYNINLALNEDYDNSPYQDIVYINRFNKGGRGDIVVIKRESGKDIIKRIIAVGGDQINILKDTNDGLYYVYIKYNGEGEFIKQEEPYIKAPLEMELVYKNEWLKYDRNDGLSAGNPVTVPEGEVFVMGDNRYNSVDSINIGTIKQSDIIGAVSFSLRYNQSFLDYWWNRIFG